MFDDEDNSPQEKFRNDLFFYLTEIRKAQSETNEYLRYILYVCSIGVAILIIEKW